MTQDELIKLIAAAEQKGVEIREKTRLAYNDIANPANTIAFTGCFQVGKSTLLNRVMFGSDVLLSEGVGVATTAIPTKITYGDKKELIVFYRDAAVAPDVYREDQITEELMRSLSTATGEETRIALASKIKHLQLTLPLESIKNLTFFDTPGVDDPNQELVELTTAELLPQSDLVVLVVDAGTALSQYSKSFLCKSIFQQGMSRVLVLASYNPKYYKSAEERTMILDTIKAMLAQIGRSYIPVYSYTYDETVDGDILRGPQEIMSCILNFIESNKMQAKIDKTLFYLYSDYVAATEGVRAQLEVCGKSEQQLKELERKIDSAAISLDAEYVNVINHFNSRFGEITVGAAEELKFELFTSEQSALTLFTQKFEDCTDLAQVRSRIDSAVSEITPVVQNKLIAISSGVQQKTRDLLHESSETIARAAARVSITGEFLPAVSTGWAGKINPTLLKVLEIGGGFLFGNILYAIAVVVIGKVPLLKELLPHNFTRHLVLSSVEKTFKESLEAAQQDFMQQLENTSGEVKDGIKEAFTEIYADRVAPYSAALENGRSNALPAEAIAGLSAKLGELQTFADRFTA